MKVSIIVPVYNAAAYLDECIESLVNQTIDDYEIILINDGSKDNSWEIIEAYREKYPEKIITRSVENGGQGKARNIGIDLAHGEYIGFVDSDDWVSTSMFERLYNIATENNSDIVVCDIEERRSNGDVRYIKLSDEKNLMSTGGSACNKLFRKSYVGDVRFPVGVWYEDFEFATKLLLKNGTVSSLHEALYFYRIGESTTMVNNNTRKNLDIITVMEHISEAAGEEQAEKINELIVNHVLLDAVRRVTLQKSDEKQAVIDKMLKYVKKHIPNLSECPAYTNQPRNRKIIMWLNYHGMYRAAYSLFAIKNKIRRHT